MGEAHLVVHLFDIGPSMAGEVITFQEIAAWSEITGHQLTGWEASTIRRLSSAYLSEYDAASDPNRPAPFSPRLTKVDQGEVSRRILAAFQQLANPEAAAPSTDSPGVTRARRRE